MHMADAMVSPAVGGVMYALSGLVCGYAIMKLRKEEDFKREIPTMGVMGAFVFATQMVNFTIPGPALQDICAEGCCYLVFWDLTQDF